MPVYYSREPFRYVASLSGEMGAHVWDSILFKLYPLILYPVIRNLSELTIKVLHTNIMDIAGKGNTCVRGYFDKNYCLNSKWINLYCMVDMNDGAIQYDIINN